MRYWAIYADYRATNKHRVPYKLQTKDEANEMKIKKWFEITYSWLKVYDIIELDKEEYEKGNNQLIFRR